MGDELRIIPEELWGASTGWHKNEMPVASATETLERHVEIDYDHQPVEAVEQVCKRLAQQVSHQWGFLHVLKQKLGPGVDVRMRLVDWNTPPHA